MILTYSLCYMDRSADVLGYFDDLRSALNSLEEYLGLQHEYKFQNFILEVFDSDGNFITSYRENELLQKLEEFKADGDKS